MPDIITSQIFSNGEKGITATKMNNIVGGSVIQPDFYNAKPSSPTLDPTDQILELKGTGAYARITGSQLINSVGSQLAAATFVTKNAAYTLTPTDSGKYFILSGGSWTLTLPAPSSGLNYRLRNDMGISGVTGIITLQPTGGTIDGAASIPLLAQQDCTIITDGTNWRTFGRLREVVLGTQDLTSAANGVILLPSGYRHYRLTWENLAPAAASAFLVMQVSSDGGTTWITSAYWQATMYSNSATTVAYQNLSGQTSIGLSNTLNNLGTPGASLELLLWPGGATQYPNWFYQQGGLMQGGTLTGTYVGNGFYNSPLSVNALRYNMNTGNILSSLLTVKGVA